MISGQERYLFGIALGCLLLAGLVIASIHTSVELLLRLRRYGQVRAKDVPAEPVRRAERIMAAIMAVFAGAGAISLIAIVVSVLRQIRN